MADASIKPARLPSQDVLLRLLRYEAETGKLFWRDRPPEMFSREKDWVGWQTRYAGCEAFTTPSKGYWQGSLCKKTVAAHRVAWKMATGEEPWMLDHINGNRADNRLINLRVASPLDNARNAARYRCNESGIAGVRWHSTRRKWQAYIRSGSLQHLGYFSTLEDAAAARKAAEARLEFHPNSGREPNP